MIYETDYLEFIGKNGTALMLKISEINDLKFNVKENWCRVFYRSLMINCNLDENQESFDELRKIFLTKK
jgi:hypothetical protein